MAAFKYCPVAGRQDITCPDHKQGISRFVGCSVISSAEDPVDPDCCPPIGHLTVSAYWAGLYDKMNIDSPGARNSHLIVVLSLLLIPDFCPYLSLTKIGV